MLDYIDRAVCFLSGAFSFSFYFRCLSHHYHNSFRERSQQFQPVFARLAVVSLEANALHGFLVNILFHFGFLSEQIVVYLHKAEYWCRRLMSVICSGAAFDDAFSIATDQTRLLRPPRFTHYITGFHIAGRTIFYFHIGFSHSLTALCLYTADIQALRMQNFRVMPARGVLVDKLTFISLRSLLSMRDDIWSIGIADNSSQLLRASHIESGHIHVAFIAAGLARELERATEFTSHVHSCRNNAHGLATLKPPPLPRSEMQ